MIWALVIGCYSDKVDFTGGGEVRMTLDGDNLAEVDLTVDGMSEQELDNLFADSHHPPEVFDELEDQRRTPAYAAALYLGYPKRDETYVSVGDNDVDGFEPCGVAIRHAELYIHVESAVGTIQFDERPGDDPTVTDGGLAPDTIIGTFDSDDMSTDIVFEDFEIDDLSGFGEGPVSVQCPDRRRGATFTLEWEFDEDVHRRAHQRGWSGISYY